MDEAGSNSDDGVRAEIAVAYRDHRDALRRVAFASLFDAGLQADADDLVNTAVAEVLEKLPVGVQNWEAYLVRIVKRRAIDLIRSARVRHGSAAFVDQEMTPDDRDLLGDVDDQIDVIDSMARATDALNELDTTLRTVAYECLWNQKPQKVVADQLGLTQARVSQLLADARTIIQDSLGDAK
ncbi:sigma-70 family RNA polymerase sigma factor [Frigoribacterium sp. CFBP 8759]|uniref:sigma-70 family RNA polymerase sigma factor n=1 Tax=Frigoribacterium sp. CFBP 8759 TaxID=2775283 RepID=UPI00178737BB|nr:sigma-70 family RNA polymerase sigma factor [Frigoribacterium sp. CFBP 8759]